MLPLRPGLPEQATHDYKRNGTATLFATQNVGPGTATDHCYDRHGKGRVLTYVCSEASTQGERLGPALCPMRSGAFCPQSC